MDSINKVSLLSTAVWLKLSQETRRKIAELFQLTKTGESMVNNGPYGAYVVSDGYNPHDFWPITVEKMNQILQTEETDFYKLFVQIVEMIEKPIPKEAELNHAEEKEVESVHSKDNVCEECEGKRGYHKIKCSKYPNKQNAKSIQTS